MAQEELLRVIHITNFLVYLVIGDTVMKLCNIYTKTEKLLKGKHLFLANIIYQKLLKKVENLLLHGGMM